MPGTVLIIAIVITVLLLSLNAFFAMAEFAVVRVRGSRISELAQAGDRRAIILTGIQSKMDEYLSVVQVGITCAGIGLGLVLDQGLSEALQRALPGGGMATRITGLVISFAIGTYLSVVFGELVPKALAIRDTERVALRCAPALRVFHRLFWVPLKVLSISARTVLRLLGHGGEPAEPPHTEEELRIILGASQEGGVMSFRRLLMVENVFDLGALRVRDAMRGRQQALALRVGMTEDDVLQIVRDQRFSRYPLVDPAEPNAMPVGVVHIKDLLVRDRQQPFDLRLSARPYLAFREDMPLEQALIEFQRSHRHLAMVHNAAGEWAGIVSLEDVIEDIVGQIHDEFEREPLELGDLVHPDRVLVDVRATSVEEVLQTLVAAVPTAELPSSTTTDQLRRMLIDRERSLSTYVGHGIALPHVRLEGLRRPLIVIARLQQGIPVPGRHEQAKLFFLLLTPANDPRIHIRLLSRIANLTESDYVMTRLQEATTPREALEAMLAGSGVASS